nr:immunoglobulin heavy chain junction region [Mus musculus]
CARSFITTVVANFDYW